MKKSMDLFGKALLAYANGDKSKFFFADSSGNKYEHPLRKLCVEMGLELEIIERDKGHYLARITKK